MDSNDFVEKADGSGTGKEAELESRTKLIVGYELTGQKYNNWRMPNFRRLIAALKRFRDWIWNSNLPGTNENIGKKVKDSPGKIVELLEAKAKKDIVENELTERKAELAFQQHETEKLNQQLVKEQIEKTKAETDAVQLDNESRRLEIFARLKELTDGKPPMRVIPTEDAPIIAFADLNLSDSSFPNLDELGLNTRIVNALNAYHLESTQELCSCTKDELLAVKGIGEKSVSEIELALAQFDLKLVER